MDEKKMNETIKNEKIKNNTLQIQPYRVLPELPCISVHKRKSNADDTYFDDLNIVVKSYDANHLPDLLHIAFEELHKKR